MGVGYAVVIATFLACTTSFGVSLIVYTLINPAIMSVPIAMIMPVAVPLVLTPPFFFLILAPLDRLRIRSAELARSRIATEEANSRLQEFLATLTHEVRSPLRRMIAALQQVETASLSTAQRAGIGTISYTSEALAVIVDDLLDLSRNGGASRGGESTFGVRSLIASIVELHSARADAKGLTITQSIGDAVPDCLHGNVSIIRQVLMTLVGNAVKATIKGAVAIRVDAPRSISVSRDMVRFSVVDTGPGVDPALCDTLLGAPLSRQPAVSAGRMPHSGVTGLSLPTCRQLIEDARGDMGFESMDGGGSTFWFTMNLPAAEPSNLPSSGSPPLISEPSATRLPPTDHPESDRGSAGNSGVSSVTASEHNDARR
tara:strand:- start:1322 stop:2437 length:1116 start_codon:yes stop_codon:yes gene_type:complete